MGYPASGTVPVPWPDAPPALVALVERAPLDPGGWRPRLVGALGGADLGPGPAGEAGPGPGHLCATAWVFDRGGQHVLLVRHRTLGWVQPGGHIDPGEWPVVAARRELREETGLDLDPDGGDVPAVLHPAIFPARGEDPAHRHWNLGYRFTGDPGMALVPEAGAPVAWFGVGDLPSPTTPDVAPLVALLAPGVR